MKDILSFNNVRVAYSTGITPKDEAAQIEQFFGDMDLFSDVTEIGTF